MPPVRALPRAIPLLLSALALPRGAAGAPAAPLPVGALQKAIERREQWRRTRLDVYLNDFGELGRYRKANATLKAPAPGESRVVFLGDSITDVWRLETSFPGKPYLNRGISGQTTAQLLIRFRQDVIDLKPRAVVILAGTNDIAGNTGPMSNEDIEANFATMIDLCRVHGIAVVLASILPVHNYTPESDIAFPPRSPERIVELNRWLKAHAASSGATYLDYFSAMVDQKGWLKRDLAEDGLHPNGAGYAIMARLASAAIAKAVPASPQPPSAQPRR
jgi:lysophospholipase L1-like esterase